MEITGMNGGKIYATNKKDSYRVSINFDKVFVECKNGEESSPEKGWSESYTLCEWDNNQWCEFFSSYLVKRNNKLSGKLHSIIESFGGSIPEIKARKSVAFQLLGLKSLS